jgi:hypothetical protein
MPCASALLPLLLLLCFSGCLVLHMSRRPASWRLPSSTSLPPPPPWWPKQCTPQLLKQQQLVPCTTPGLPAKPTACWQACGGVAYTVRVCYARVRLQARGCREGISEVSGCARASCVTSRPEKPRVTAESCAPRSLIRVGSGSSVSQWGSPGVCRCVAVNTQHPLLTLLVTVLGVDSMAAAGRCQSLVVQQVCAYAQAGSLLLR